MKSVLVATSLLVSHMMETIWIQGAAFSEILNLLVRGIH